MSACVAFALYLPSPWSVALSASNTGRQRGSCRSAAELVMRRPLPDRVLQGLQVVGVLMVLALMVFALGNDFVRQWRMSQPS